MLAVLASLLFFPAEETDGVKALLQKAGPANAKEVRIQAIGDLEKTPVKNPQQVCRVLEQYTGEKDDEIRSAALVSLGLIASSAKLECPLMIVEAIDDRDEGIRSNTQGLVYMFERFPKAAVPLIFRAADSKESELREFAAIALPHVVGKTLEVKEKLNQMLDDPEEFVRHHAHIGHYKATGDFKLYVTYLLACTSDINPPHPTETDAQKRDQVRRNLIRVAVGTFFYESTRERPKELANVLISNLAHQEAPVRQAALRQLRVMAIASQESYEAIPKAKAQTEVAKFLEDKNEKVREWAQLMKAALENGPPPEAPKKLKPLEQVTPRDADAFGTFKLLFGDMP